MRGRRGPAALARLCLPLLKRAHSQTQSPISLAQQTDRAAAGAGPHSSFQKGKPISRRRRRRVCSSVMSCRTTSPSILPSHHHSARHTQTRGR